MDLKRLRTFVTVAEQGTVSQAAAILHITQPALSRQIGSLEQELGFMLFDRVGGRLELTTRGEQLLGDCRSLLAHAGTLNERAQALRRGEIRVLRVVASALTIEGAFPTFLRRYAASVPGVQIALIEANADQHLDMLERGEVHLSVNVLNFIHVDDHRFASYLLPQFQVLSACAPSQALEHADCIDIRELAQHPLLLPNASYATRTIFDAACRLASMRPKVFVESGSARALLALAEEGHGIAIIPSILSADEQKLRVMPVTHRGSPLQITLAVLWDRRRILPRYAEGFSELLDAHMRDAFPSERAPRDAVTPRRRSTRASSARAPLPGMH